MFFNFFTGPLEGTYNSGGGGFNFGAVNNGLMVNGQNTGTQTNNMPQSADEEADKEAMKEAKEKGETPVFFSITPFEKSKIWLGKIHSKFCF